MYINMPPLVKKLATHLLAVLIIGVSVWVPSGIVSLPFAKADVQNKFGKVHNRLAGNTLRQVMVKDNNGNTFQMRQLNGNQYPPLVKEAMQMAEILICREYTYGGEKWYEWCTEEAGEWVLYRWEKGQTTLRKVI